MRKVIVNSTPMIILSKLGLLDLLQTMYGEIVIPDAVYREISRKNDAIKHAIEERDWIRVVTIENTNSKLMYKAKLHDGEVEVMILAQERCGEHLVIIDDSQARKTAEYLGLNLTGTIGVLINAKDKGLVAAVMPIIAEMEKNGFYISERQKERIKHIAREDQV